VSETAKAIEVGLGAPVEVASGRTHRLVLCADQDVTIEVAIDPEAAETCDDLVILKCEDDGREWRLSLRTDGVKRPGGALLVFRGCPRGKSYSCSVDPGKEGKPYFLFKKRRV
jgi:hypothetical protein